MKELNNKDKLEERIRDCWNVVNDVHVLNEAFQDKNMTPDQVANTLLGIEYLYQLKFERLFEQFEKMMESGEITVK